MALSDLPTLYDLTDPSSNLAGGGLALDVPRFTWGESVIPAGVAAILASERYGLLGGLAAAVAGYIAPLPVVGALLAQQASRAFDNSAVFSGLEMYRSGKDPRRPYRQRFRETTHECIRYKFVNVRGQGRVRRCAKYRKYARPQYRWRHGSKKFSVYGR